MFINYFFDIIWFIFEGSILTTVRYSEIFSFTPYHVLSILFNIICEFVFVRMTKKQRIFYLGRPFSVRVEILVYK